MENESENKIYSAGYADTFHGADDFSTEFSAFYEKEPDGTIGASNLYVLTSGTKGSSGPEVTARFAAKKILYEYFHTYDDVDAKKLALAMRSANNEIYEYAKVQSDNMSAAAIAASVTDGKVAIATVGGSRAYIIRNGKVFQITEDPAVIDEKVQSGEITPEEAYGEEGAIPPALGIVRDITTDVYDGIEVRGGDTLLLCSATLDTFIGKKEILDAVADNSPRTIVQQLLSLPSLQNAGVPASVAAIRIYDSESVDMMIRVDGMAPADTDLNLEKKEVELLRKNKPRKTGEESGQKKDRLPGIILGILALLLLLAGGVWAAGHYGLLPEGVLGNVFPPTETPTPTVDWVRESMTVYELTAEAEKEAAVAATVAAWPTQTPYPTFTPVFIDLDEPTAAPAAESVLDIVAPGADTDENSEETGDEENLLGDEAGADEAEDEPAATATPEPTQIVIEIPEDQIIKEDYVEEKSGVELLYVPAGEFLLGSDLSVDGYADADEETPQLAVYLDGYWVGKTEVTNREYLKCVEAGVCEMNNYMSIYIPGLEDDPITYVTSDQAERFCSWIGGRLPTEYEWEKAARGVDGRIYPWGSEEPTLENDLANIPYYVDANGDGMDLFAVGSFPKGASPYGALDMAGNVWEWTSTWYSLNYYETLAAEEEISGSVVSNPTGPEAGSSRVIRGGSCSTTEVNNYEVYMRTASRSYVNMSSSYYVGFRCVVPDVMVEAEELDANDLGPEGPQQGPLGPEGPQGPQNQPQGPRP